MPQKKFLLCWILFFATFFLTGLAIQASAEDSTQEKAEPNSQKTSGLTYVVKIEADEKDSTLVKLMQDSSQLIWLKDEHPDSRTYLERRAMADEETAEKVLRSQGYYNGKVSRIIDWDAKPIQVIIKMEQGIQAKISKTTIQYRQSTLTAENEPVLTNEEIFPPTLTIFGLKEGDPAIAESILDAVNAITKHLAHRGYPLSKLADTQYILMPEDHTIRADILVDTGPFLRMGSITTEGVKTINEKYLKRLIPWRKGEPWDVDKVQTYRSSLQETGLFSVLDLRPDLSDSADGTAQKSLTPLHMTVTEAPKKSLGGGLQYSTDKGPGLSGFWEHRNVFGNGERLRITTPISQDLQFLGVSFRKPEFGRRHQALVAEGELRNEKSDAYDQTAAYGAVGLERRLRGAWRNWRASIRGSVEGGTIKDRHGSKDYYLFGIPIGLNRDTTDDLFNPTKGTKLTISVTPYTGTYDGMINTVRSRVDGSAYYMPKNDRLVLAARGSAGSLSGGSEQKIPAPLRFYVGGGGSVRGYKYQSIGPEDEDGDPAGGRSFMDMSFEARFRVGENFGIVPFIDSGMVYDTALPEFGKDLQWGAGLGFRYYTSIGPVRLDIGVPFQDKDRQKKIQVYFSIGQAF